MKRQPKILVIEDNADLRFMYRHALEMDGAHVTAAESGAVALEVLSSTELPDLIMLDLTLPEMSGVEFLQKLKQDDRFKTVRIIIISGFDDLKLRTEGFNIWKHLKKPFELNQLTKLIEELKQSF